MKIHLLKLKAELKVLANEIKELKKTRKSCPNGYVSGLASAQEKFRIRHITRCLLRGRTLEQIEPKLRDPNSYTHQWVRKQAAKLVSDIMKEVSNVQTLCIGAE